MGRRPSSGGWELPKTYGAYELRERLGGGTLGELFLARRIADDLPAQVRVFPPSFAARIPRVLEEARAVAALAHPNIRAVYDMGRESGTFFMAMEVTDAPTLEEWLADEDDPLPFEQGCAALAQIARALHAAHEAGVIHGHLRPENVLVAVTDDGVEAKAENFGFEKLRTASMLVASGSVDRARFLSPEQALEAERFDARSDVYAVGVMLYRLACGRYHVEGQTIHEILRRIAEGNYIAPRVRRRDIDPDVEAVIERCLALAPEERYSSARALASDLDRLATGDKSRARDMAPIKVRTRRLGRRRRRWPWMAAAAAVGAVVAAVAWAPRVGGGRGAEGPAAPSPAAAPSPVPGPGRAEHDPPVVVDHGRAVCEEAERRLAAGDANAAVAALTGHLTDFPDDAAALALRGRASIARGAIDVGLADLDRAAALSGAEAEPAKRARAVASWHRFVARCEAGTLDGDTWAWLDQALCRADALPRPVDPVARLVPLIRGGGDGLGGWAADCERAVPAGLLREFLRYSERHPLDPPGDPTATYAEACTHWPQWAAPHAYSAIRLRAAGDREAAAAALARAEALDPEHAAVHFARALIGVLDAVPGAVARGADAWQAARGPTPLNRRAYFLGLRDRAREAADPVAAVGAAMAYLRQAPPEDIPLLAQECFGHLRGVWLADLQSLAGAEALTGRAAAVPAAVPAAVAGDAAGVDAAVAAVLADDPDGAGAACLVAIRSVDRTGRIPVAQAALRPWFEGLLRAAKGSLQQAQMWRRRGEIAEVHRLVGNAIDATGAVPMVLEGMQTYGRAVLEIGRESDFRTFQGYLDGFIARRAPGVDLWARQWRARIHERHGRSADARADLDAAVAQAPTEPRVFLARAEWAARTGALAPAAADVERAISLAPDYGRSYAVRGFLRQQDGDLTAAHADYHAALERGYRMPTIAALAALAAAGLGESEHALADCALATGDPERGRAARLVRAWIFWNGERRADALDELADAAALRPVDMELDLPLEALLRPIDALLQENAADVALICFQRAEQGLGRGDRGAAGRALTALERFPAQDAGRQAYLAARVIAGSDRPGAVDAALDQLAAAAAAGYRPADGFGTDTEFDRLRSLERFERICAGAR